MSDETNQLQKLNKRQQVFINEYLSCFNGAEAARRAGYSEKSARQTASDLLSNPDISLHIQERLSEVHMSADEALKLTADIARGDVAQYINTFGGIDIDKVRENGRLIKKIRTRTITKIGKTETDEDTEITDTEIELYPADSALYNILKVHGKFTDKVDLSNSDGTLKQGEIGVRLIDYRVGITETETRPSENSITPSQDENPGDGQALG